MTAGYTYNGKGQRVKKVVNGTPTIFHYNRQGLLIAETDQSGHTTAEYVYLNSVPLAKIEGTSVYYYANDHLGTPQKLTDATGAVVWSAEYKPFGEAIIDPSSTVTNNLRFPGQYYDAETGLNYNYYRDYNALLDRYIEADPVGLRGGINLYLYAGANSLRFTDPFGLLLGGNNATIGNPPGPVIGPAPVSPSVPNSPGPPVCMKCAQPPGLPPPGPGMCLECNWGALQDCIAMTYDPEQIEACKSICDAVKSMPPGPGRIAAAALCAACIAERR